MPPNLVGDRLPQSSGWGVKHMDLEWFKQAACTNTDSKVFYHNNIVDDLKAIGVCLDCPVMDECLEFAIKHEEHGVWGGTTERERNKIRLASLVNHLPYSHFRKHLPKLRQERHEGFSLRKSMRELEHPANVSPLLFACSLNLQTHIPEPSVMAAASLQLIFGTDYKAS